MGTGKSMYLGIPDCNKNCDYSKYKMPLVEICGQKRVLIENHLGIVDYSAQQVSIKVSFGLIDIQGNDLKITRICREKLIIAGDVEAVCIQRR